MSQRIALIGNSHAAAFKAGWDAIAGDYPDVELVFFASPASSMRLLKVENGAIVPRREDIQKAFVWTSGGLDRIPGDMDAYILVGMSFSFPHLVALMSAHRPPDAYEPDGDHQLVSEVVFEAAMNGVLRGSGASANIDRVRAISAAPIYYAPNPYSAETVLNNEAYAYWRKEATCERIFGFYRKAVDELREKCVVIEQPADTVTKRYFTLAEHARNAPKLREGAPANYADDDHGHMNGAFGARHLRAILDAHLRQGQAPAAAVAG